MIKERRTFIQQTIGIGALAATSNIISGCNSKYKTNTFEEKVSIRLKLINDLVVSPSNHFFSLDFDTRQKLESVLGDVLTATSEVPHRSSKDVLYAMSHISHKMKKESLSFVSSKKIKNNTKQTRDTLSYKVEQNQITQNNTQTYSIDSDHKKDTFSVQMVYTKKVYKSYDSDYVADYEAQGISPQDIDEIVLDAPPKYAFSFLFLIPL